MMKLGLMIVITIIAMAAIVWALIKLVEKYYNMKTILQSQKDGIPPDKNQEGIILHKEEEETKKLKDANSPITPF